MSADAPRKLVPVQPTPPEGIVDGLKAMLALAERGEILSCVIAGEGRAHDVHLLSSLGPDYDYFRLQGALFEAAAR